MDDLVNPDDFGLSYAVLKISDEAIYVLKSNDRFVQLTSLEADEEKNISRIAFGDRCKELIRDIGEKQELIIHFKTTDKTIRSRIHPEGDHTYGLVGIDYTAFKRKQELFEMRTRGYRQFVENFHGISFQRMLKPEAQSVFTAGAVEKMTGYPEEQAKDLATWLNIIHPDDRERMSELGLRLYDQPGFEEESEYRIIRKDGAVRWVRSYDSHFRSEDGDFEMAQGLIVDVTEQKLQEEKILKQNVQLEEMSMTDHMTGLSNRRFMQQVIHYHISDYKRSGVTFSLLMIDLDSFKMINDKYGHDGGDAVIIRMAEILIRELRETDIKARWGGEEFLILLPRTGKEEVLAIVEKLFSIVRNETVTHNNIDISFTFSCGITVNDTKLSEEILLKQADRALYSAKEQGRDRFVLWND